MSIVLTNRRVLVIDDNPSIHGDFRKVLLSAKPPADLEAAEAALFGEAKPREPQPIFELSFASQGEEALKRVCEALDIGQPYAAAFVDMRMPPGWDGIRTIQEIWKKDPDIQIVICTAYSEYS